MSDEQRNAQAPDVPIPTPPPTPKPPAAPTPPASPSPTPDDDDILGASGPQAENPASKDPSEWVTGDESMTAPQRSYLDTLAREAGEELPADLTKAQASELIDRLQQQTGRGKS